MVDGELVLNTSSGGSNLIRGGGINPVNEGRFGIVAGSSKVTVNGHTIVTGINSPNWAISAQSSRWYGDSSKLEIRGATLGTLTWY